MESDQQPNACLANQKPKPIFKSNGFWCFFFAIFQLRKLHDMMIFFVLLLFFSLKLASFFAFICEIGRCSQRAYSKNTVSLLPICSPLFFIFSNIFIKFHFFPCSCLSACISLVHVLCCFKVESNKQNKTKKNIKKHRTKLIARTSHFV